jgi:hypothetical protein
MDRSTHLRSRSILAESWEPALHSHAASRLMNDFIRCAMMRGKDSIKEEEKRALAQRTCGLDAIDTLRVKPAISSDCAVIPISWLVLKSIFECVGTLGRTNACVNHQDITYDSSSSSSSELVTLLRPIRSPQRQPHSPMSPRTCRH